MNLLSLLTGPETLTITLNPSQKAVLYEIAKRTIMRNTIAETRNAPYKVDEKERKRKKLNPSAKDDLITVLSLLNLSTEYRFENDGKIVNSIYYPPTEK